MTTGREKKRQGGKGKAWAQPSEGRRWRQWTLRDKGQDVAEKGNRRPLRKTEKRGKSSEEANQEKVFLNSVPSKSGCQEETDRDKEDKEGTEARRVGHERGLNKKAMSTKEQSRTSLNAAGVSIS